jgi:hypothetical protein
LRISVKVIEIGDALDAQDTASPSITKCLCWFFWGGFYESGIFLSPVVFAASASRYRRHWHDNDLRQRARSGTKFGTSPPPRSGVIGCHAMLRSGQG